MKHCFLCRWSFGETQYSADKKSPAVTVLRCYPNGDFRKGKKANRICAHYDTDDMKQPLERDEYEQ